MKTRFNLSALGFALLGFVAVSTATADETKTSPSQDALKGLQPFIGKWTGESEAFGGFEGLEDAEQKGNIQWLLHFRWLQNKAAVEFSSHLTYKKTGERYNKGSKIMALDAGTGKIRVFGYGYDGDIYFSNTGTMKSKGKSVTLTIDEVSINKTKSQYTVTFTKEAPDKISIHLEELVVDGEKLEGWKRTMQRKSEPAKK